MNSLNIEITENQYLIRLKRTDFDLNNLYLLLRTLGAEQDWRVDMKNLEDDDMIKSWKIDEDFGDRFDHLSDK